MNLIIDKKYQWNYNDDIKIGWFKGFNKDGFAMFDTIEGETWDIFLPDSQEYNFKEVVHE